LGLRKIFEKFSKSQHFSLKNFTLEKSSETRRKRIRIEIGRHVLHNPISNGGRTREAGSAA